MITILCAEPFSNYKKIPGLDIWDIFRDAYNFKGDNKIIAHPPCAQWGKLKSFAIENKKEKDLAIFCIEMIQKNGGILEHPVGSSLFKYMNINEKHLTRINQCWWNFPAKKETILYTVSVDLLPLPKIKQQPTMELQLLPKTQRSTTTTELCLYLINSIKQTK